jgi:hypothetical protein
MSRIEYIPSPRFDCRKNLTTYVLCISTKLLVKFDILIYLGMAILGFDKVMMNEFHSCRFLKAQNRTSQKPDLTPVPI